jgi:hypothetical protein
MYSIHQVE